jgi:hypothetical protein
VTLVIHGTEDPLFPPGHAVALAREIADTELLLLDGIGHQAPPRARPGTSSCPPSCDTPRSDPPRMADVQ